MNTYYTILSVAIRPEIDEKLSVGLILINNKQVSFFISESKLLSVKKLVSHSFYKGVKNSIKFIENSFKVNHNKLSNTQQVLELNIEDKSDVFNFEYIDYLSNYNNNVITFSKPIIINVEYSKELFQKLFQKFINDTDFDTIPKKVISNIESFKKISYPKVKKYFSIDKEIDSLIYPKLLMPVKIDLMGKNEIEVFAQSLDMSKSLRSIENGIADLLHINRAISQAKQFIISSEPDKSFEINHRIWNNIRKTKEFEYVDISEFDKISNYAQEHGVAPLII